MAVKLNLTIEQGETFQRTFNIKDSNNDALDMSGYLARMQVRAKYTSESPLIDVDSASKGGITIHPSSVVGRIDILVSDTVTAALPAPQVGVWDLEVVDGSDVVSKLLKGLVKINPEATK